jgi:hypothetical protein
MARPVWSANNLQRQSEKEGELMFTLFLWHSPSFPKKIVLLQRNYEGVIGDRKKVVNGINKPSCKTWCRS